MRILFVCLGNICRSPLAEGIMRNKVNQKKIDWIVDSAGTASWHTGNKPDARSVEVADQHGIDISLQKARQFHPSDFQNFDLIYAMDSENYLDIKAMASGYEEIQKIGLILNNLYPGENRSVPDPYYNNKFEQVFQLLDQACDEIILAHSK